jgi:hypothetical protein
VAFDIGPSPFRETGLALFQRYAQFGDTPVWRIEGIFFVLLDEGAASLAQLLTQTIAPGLQSSIKPGTISPFEAPKASAGAYVFVGAQPGMAAAMTEKVDPGPGEACFFVEGTAAPTAVCAVVLGSAQAKTFGDTSAKVRPALAQNRLQQMVDTGRLMQTTFDDIVSLLNVEKIYTVVLEQIPALIRALPKQADLDLFANEFSMALEATVLPLLRRVLDPAQQLKFATDDGHASRDEILNFDFAANTLSTAKHADKITAAVATLMGNVLAQLPVVAQWVIDAFFATLKDEYQSQRSRKLVQANLRFQATLAQTVLSLDAVDEVVKGYARTIGSNQQQIGDLVVGAAVIGVEAFTAGTVYGFGFDMYNTFEQIFKYSCVGIHWIYLQDKNAIEKAINVVVGSPSTQADLEPGLRARDSTIREWFPSVAFEKFLKRLATFSNYCAASR